MDTTLKQGPLSAATGTSPSIELLQRNAELSSEGPHEQQTISVKAPTVQSPKLARRRVVSIPCMSALLFLGAIFILAFPLRFSARFASFFQKPAGGFHIAKVAGMAGIQRPLTTSSSGPLRIPPQPPPLFTGTAESIVSDTKRLIRESRAVQDRLVDSVKPGDATFRNVMTDLAQDENEMALESRILGFYQAVSARQELRDASTKSDQLMDEFSIESAMREDVYGLVEAVYKRNESGLDAESRRFVEKNRKMYVRNGLSLPKGPKRDRYRDIKLRLSELAIQFQKALNEETGGIWFTPAELDGVPEDVVQNLEKGTGDHDGNLKMTFKYPHLFPTLKYAKNPETRKRMLIGNENKVNDNVPLFKEAIVLRDEAARFLGYKDHAQFRIEDKMMKTPEHVDKFLGGLREKLTPLAHKELAALETIKKEHLKKNGEKFDGHFYNWDNRYYSRIQIEQNFQLDQEKLADYFPLSCTIRGMLRIFEELLGFHFVELVGDDRAKISPTGKADDIVWHEDVQVFSVWDDESAGGGFVGYLYLDLHPRDGKYGHAANFNLQPGFLNSNGTRRYPATALVCNFSKPTPKKPSLLKHDEVVTLFHGTLNPLSHSLADFDIELGHGIHDLAGRVKFSRFHGTSVVQDFVEAPSQMLENWCWTPSQLKSLSHHYSSLSPAYLEAWRKSVTKSSDATPTDPPPTTIPDELIASLIKTKHVNEALANLRQLFFGIFDMRVHEPASHADVEKVDTTELFNRLRAEVVPIEGPERIGLGWKWGNGEATFGHLIGGYDAGYYGYLSSQVYSMDMFDSVFKKDPMDPKEGRRYRRTVLEKGGSRDEMESLVEFLGREPSSDAFYKELGLSV